ncbi:MAG: T9SS type A sorting domain-containing protein [Bacteroidota bacterium]
MIRILSYSAALLLCCTTPLFAQVCILPSENNTFGIRVSLETEIIRTQQSGPSCQFGVELTYEVEILNGTVDDLTFYNFQIIPECFGSGQTFTFNLTSLANNAGAWDGNVARGTIQNPSNHAVTGLCADLVATCSYSGILTGENISLSSFDCITGVDVSSAASALPVDLLEFKGELSSEGFLLKWITSQEENNFGFFVQRAEEDFNWEDIGFLSGQGTTTEQISYQFLDPSPLSGNNYYRLKQVDFNGEYSYSSIVALQQDPFALPYLAFPNPFNSQLTFVNPIGTYTLYDARGKICYQQIEGSSVQQINTESLPKGVYLLQVGDEWGGNSFQRLVK